MHPKALALRLLPIASGIALSAIAGCAHHDAAAPLRSPQAKHVATPPSATTQTTSATPAPPKESAGLRVSGELAKVCDIQVQNVESAPKFDFDSSLLREDDRSVLDQLAKCVTTGPLKGRRLRLIGRADPRGEEEYNFVLGEHRATAVRDYLVNLGVAGSALSETSRGKLDAMGTDEESWQRDRRVDVDLD